jgi:hypothetical protein
VRLSGADQRLALSFEQAIEGALGIGARIYGFLRPLHFIRREEITEIAFLAI